MGTSLADGVHGLECGGSADQERAGSVALFSSGEQCEKPLRQRVQEKPKMTLRNPGLVEKFEDLHQKECQRFCSTTLQNSVPGENRRDLHL